MTRGADPRRYLFVVWEGGGTIPPEMAIARRLVDRGHEVHVLGDPCVESDARAAGCSFSPYRRAPHRLSRDPDTDLLREWEAKGQLGSFLRARDRLFFGPAYEFALDTLETLEQFPADVVCVDNMLFGGMVGAEKAGLPTAILMPNIYTYPAPGIPPIGPGFQPARGPLGRLRDAAYHRVSTRLLQAGLEYLNDARTRLGLRPLRSLMEQVESVERILVLTSKAFDFKARKLPASVRYVGPQLDDPSWVVDWKSPWPGLHPNPLVAVSFSTTFQNQGRPLRRAIQAMSGLPVRGLVTLGPSLDPRDFPGPENVVTVPSAPHSAVFREASVVVTHAGHGTLMKAIAAGVPVVCLPMGRDQNDNAARVVASGVGIRLSARALSRTLRGAIRRVLEDPSYRENARRLASAISLETRRPLAVEELEGLARRHDRPRVAERQAQKSARSRRGKVRETRELAVSG